MLSLVSFVGLSFAPVGKFQLQQTRASAVAARTSDVSMINLFGNTEESKKRRQDLSLRSAPAGSRVVSFRKESAATQGLQLGLKFRESFGKAVYIDKILPGSQAANLEAKGQLRVGDEITMVSATFGDEMWSARGVGKYRLEKSIAVRQGMFIKFVVEQSDDNSKKRQKEIAELQKKEKAKTTRLQQQLAAEVDAQKGKKKGFFGF